MLFGDVAENVQQVRFAVLNEMAEVAFKPDLPAKRGCEMRLAPARRFRGQDFFRHLKHARGLP